MAVTEEQIQFGGEFVLFLVALAGIAVLALRAEAVVERGLGRFALVVGFLALAAAAFLRGSLLIDDALSPAVLAPGVAGVVGVVAGTTRWRASDQSRWLLWIGGLLVAGAIAASVLDAPEVDAGLRVAGSVAMGAALVAASRRSIVARIATSAAVTLLLVVLVLSIALSAVLSSTVEDEAVRRVGGLGQIEAQHINEAASREAIKAAQLVAQLLARSPDTSAELVLRDDAPARSDLVSDRLDLYLNSFLSPDFALAYLTSDRIVVAATDPLAPSAFAPLAGSRTVRETVDERERRGSAEIVGGTAMAIGAVPVKQETEPGVQRVVGIVAAVVVLDDGYLQIRLRGAEADTAFVIAAPSGVLASHGEAPPTRAVERLARRVIADGDPASTVTGDWIVVAQPVQDALERPILAFVVATPHVVVDDVRESLFRTLFLIALGGAVLALALAAFVGDRIGSGLRRLTTAAEAVQQGERGVRADIVTEDEVGVLGAAFDAMVASNEDKETALREAADDETRLRNRLEAVVAGVGEALVAIDADGRITDFNGAAEALVGLSADEARGRRADEVVALYNDEGVDLSARLHATGERWSVTGYVVSGSGEHVPIAASGGILEGLGREVAGGVFTFRDLRREREVERMKTEFLSRVGHELRTPLAPIVGYSTILSTRDVMPEQVRDLAGNIHASAERLARIVQLLEFFATTQAGRNVLRPEPVDVRSLIDEVVHRWDAKLDRSHRLSRRVARRVGRLWADRKWVDISIDELIDNAVKFSPDGGTIRITAEPGSNGVAGVRISVVDQGKGMTGEELERAFAEFSQGDESDTRRYGGLGLGLALVREVVERHGGEVRAESAGTDRGSKFSIFLPAVPIEEQDAGTARRARSDPDRPSDGGLHTG